MILVELSGGIGNQMFQYAFAYVLAHKNNTNIKLEVSFFDLPKAISGHTPRNFELNIFPNSYNFSNSDDINFFLQPSKCNQLKKKFGLNYPKIYLETQFHFQQELATIKSSAFIKGYFQSYKYWNGLEDTVRKIFHINENKLDEINARLLFKIKNTNSIAVHIRRGDYITDSVTQQFHGNCSFEYYMNAIHFIASKTKNFTLVFFSDDSNWVQSQFEHIPFSKIFLSHNFDQNSWKDLYLMQYCQHNIIANSSFSWWAAWLNQNPDKIVVAPKKWFAVSESEKNTNDLIPSEWFRM